MEELGGERKGGGGTQRQLNLFGPKTSHQVRVCMQKAEGNGGGGKISYLFLPLPPSFHLDRVTQPFLARLRAPLGAYGDFAHFTCTYFIVLLESVVEMVRHPCVLLHLNTSRNGRLLPLWTVQL